MTRFDLDTKLLAGAALAVGVALAGPANAQFVVTPASYFAGAQPSGIAAGDFNGDGFTDLAATAEAPDRIVTILGSATGVFTPGPASLLPNSSSPQDLVAGDLDGDGDVDLAVALRDDPNGAVRIMLNTGAGSFAMGASVAVGDRPRGLSIGDLEPDGDLDLAVANRDSNSASVLTNNGAGAFTAVTIAVGDETRATVLANFDGDADLDLAVTNHGGRTIATFTNNGGAFAAGTPLGVGPAVRPDGIAAADLDNDGDTDLAVAVSDQTLGIAQVNVYLNGGGGVFSGPVAYDAGAPVAQNTSNISAADLDCDGLMDLVVVNTDSSNVSMLRNTGGGIYGPAQLMATGAEPDDLAVGDFDGDGDADFATANKTGGDFTVFSNGTCTADVPGDANGDGLTNFQDLLQLLATWGVCGGCPADFDGNGFVDFSDLLFLLANWTG